MKKHLLLTSGLCMLILSGCSIESEAVKIIEDGEKSYQNIKTEVEEIQSTYEETKQTIEDFVE